MTPILAAISFDSYTKWFAANWITALFWHVTIVGLVAFLVVKREQTSKFVREVRDELAKCTWPWDPMQKGLRRYKELIDSTVVVIVSMLLLGSYTSAFDFVLMKVVGWIIKLNLV